MSQPDPDVYLLPLGHLSLLYAPLRGGAAALLSPGAASEVSAWLRGATTNADPALEPVLELLQEPALPAPVERAGALRPMFLGILPTRACNMSCVYCDFDSTGTGHDRLSADKAVAAVDWMADHLHAIGEKNFEVQFFGGEPFVERRLVEIVVHRVRACSAELGLTPRFEASTNGLFDAGWARFVADYFDGIVLSFDGFASSHDMHRPIAPGKGSFDRVVETAKRLQDSTLELCFRCSVNHQSVHELPDVARFFCESFEPAYVNFETVQDNPVSQRGGLKAPDPYEFARRCAEAMRIVESHNIPVSYASIADDAPQETFCPAGRDTCIISPDGRISSCYLPQRQWVERGLDMDIGQLNDDLTVQIDAAAVEGVRRVVHDKPRCETCFAKYSCAGGCHVNHSYPGCTDDYDDFCVQTRLLLADKILRRLGRDGDAEALLADDQSMRKLALHPDDRVAPGKS